MIPYDDLVAALATWRQRQGLPVSPSAAAAAARAAAPRAASPPAAHVVAAHAPAVHVAAAQVVEEVEETQYDAEGDDYAIPLGVPGESTPVGGAPGVPKRSDW